MATKSQFLINKFCNSLDIQQLHKLDKDAQHSMLNTCIAVRNKVYTDLSFENRLRTNIMLGTLNPISFYGFDYSPQTAKSVGIMEKNVKIQGSKFENEVIYSLGDKGTLNPVLIHGVVELDFTEWDENFCVQDVYDIKTLVKDPYNMEKIFALVPTPLFRKGIAMKMNPSESFMQDIIAYQPWAQGTIYSLVSSMYSQNIRLYEAEQINSILQIISAIYFGFDETYKLPLRIKINNDVNDDCKATIQYDLNKKYMSIYIPNFNRNFFQLIDSLTFAMLRINHVLILEKGAHHGDRITGKDLASIFICLTVMHNMIHGQQDTPPLFDELVTPSEGITLFCLAGKESVKYDIDKTTVQDISSEIRRIMTNDKYVNKSPHNTIEFRRLVVKVTTYLQKKLSIFKKLDKYTSIEYSLLINIITVFLTSDFSKLTLSRITKLTSTKIQDLGSANLSGINKDQIHLLNTILDNVRKTYEK